MRKSCKKLTVTAAMVAAALGMSGCVLKDGPQVVYGPPIGYDEDIDEIEDVYGPPIEEFDDDSEDISEEETSEEDTLEEETSETDTNEDE